MQNKNDQKRFSWLHFSDLQCSPKFNQINNEHWQILKSDLEEIHKERGPFDVIFITGDISYSGEKEEYKFVTDIFGDLLKHLKKLGSKPIILTVPGNHDVTKSITEEKLESRLLSFLSKDSQLRADFWKPRSPLLSLVKESFSNYSDWIQQSKLPIPKRRKKGVIPGDFSFTVKSNELKIGVIGLNSAFNHLVSGSFYGKTVLDPLQLKGVCGSQPDVWASNHHFNILLTHHSPDSYDSEFQSVFKTEISPPGRFAFHLCGNSPHRTVISSDLGSGLLLQLPSSKLNRGLEFNYFAGSVTLDDRLSDVTIRSRYYNSKQKKFIEDTNNLNFPPNYLNNYFNSTPDLNINVRKTSQDKLAPIRIDKIEIKNFRGFKNLVLDLNHPTELQGNWTCLAGINGAGKSSILQAICLSFLGMPSILELGGERLDRMNHTDEGIPYEAQIKAYFTQGGKPHFIDLQLAEALGNHDRQSPSSKIMLDFWKDLKSQVCVAYGATRNISDYRDQRHSNLSSEVSRVMTLFDPLSQITSAEVLLKEYDSDNSPLLKLFKELLKEIFEDTIGVDYNESKITFTFRGKPVNAIDLPDGFRSTVAWLVDLCAAWYEKFPDIAEKGNPSDIEGLVLIDEIDLHLHPSMQRIIVPRLRAALHKVQWIVTTHSPLILSSFDSAEIIALDRDEPGGIRLLDRQIMGFTTDQIYDWLMGTPPTSSVIEQKLLEVTTSSNQSSESVAELLEMSPEIDQAEARDIVQKRQERLKKLELMEKI